MSPKLYNIRPDENAPPDTGILPSSLRIEGATLSALHGMVSDAALSAPGLGLEIGGLLLGAPGEEVLVTGVEPLKIEHRFGPSFSLCSSDIESAKGKIGKKETSVVGHFRSCMGEEPEIDDVDYAISGLMATADPFLVLIPVVEGRAEEGIVYRRRQGVWVRLPDRVPSPALSATLSHSNSPTRILSPSAPHDPPRAVPPAPAAAAPAIPPPLPVAAPAAPRRRQWVGGAVIATVGLLVAGGLLWWQGGPRRSEPGAALGLRTQLSGGDIRIDWNRTSPAILQATSGLLKIHDGDSTRELHLNQEQLHSGGVSYVPVSSQVEIRLEAYRNQALYSGEFVVVMTTARPTVVDRPIETPRPVEAEHRDAPSSSVTAATTRIEKPRPAESTAPNTSASRVREAIAKPFVLPKAPAQQALPAPPQANSTFEQKDPAILKSLAAAPTAPGAALPANSNAATAVTSTAAAPERAAALNYVAPVPLHRVNPAVPVHLRGVVDRQVTLDVRVMIDANGRVTSATPAGIRLPAQRVLAPLAVQAALQWSFEPARRGGEAVGSEFILRFNFERHDPRQR